MFDDCNIASVGVLQCYLKVVSNYVKFSGRASRKEFWSFFLINTLIGFGLSFLGGGFGRIKMAASGSDQLPIYAYFPYYIYSAIVFLPGLAVCCRRLHDIDASGWRLLVVLPIFVFCIPTKINPVIPEPLRGMGSTIIMLILLVCFVLSLFLFASYFRRGTQGPNKYGDDPYEMM